MDKEQELRNQLNHLTSTNSMLTARIQSMSYANALAERKIAEYEKKFNEFNSLKWYKKLKYKF